MTRQNMTLLKTEKFLSKYSNILFFQHTNLSVNQWSHLRTQVKNLPRSDLFFLKNSMIKTLCLKQAFGEQGLRLRERTSQDGKQEVHQHQERLLHRL